MSEQQGSKRRLFKFDNNSSKKPKKDDLNPKESAPVGGSGSVDSSIGGTLSVGVSAAGPPSSSGAELSFLQNSLRPGPGPVILGPSLGSRKDFTVFAGPSSHGLDFDSSSILTPQFSAGSSTGAFYPYVQFPPRPWLPQNKIDTYGDVQMLCGAALESVLTMGLPPSSPEPEPSDDPAAAAANPVSSSADSGTDPDDGPHPESESESNSDPDRDPVASPRPHQEESESHS